MLYKSKNFTCGGGAGGGSVGVGWGRGEVALPPLSVEPKIDKKYQYSENIKAK